MENVKKIFLGLSLLFLPLEGYSFWTNSANLESLHKNIEINLNQDLVEVQITHSVKFLDPSLPAQYIFSFPHTPQDLNFFVELKASDYGVFKEFQATQKIFELAKSYQSPEIFGLHNQAVLLSAPLKPISSDKLTLKLKYTIKADFIQDMFLTDLNLQDGLETQNFEVKITAPKIPHLIPIIEGKGTFLENETQRIWWWQSSDFSTRNNLQIWWSEIEKPTINFQFLDYDYQGQLEVFEPIPDEKVVLLLDTSGSMYGRRWKSAVEAIYHFLDHRPSSLEFKIGFMGSDLTFWDDNWRVNNRATRQSLIEKLATIIPLGKNNFETLNQSAETLGLEEAGKFIFIGDFINFELPAFLDKKLFFILDFADQNPLSLEVQKHTGKYLYVLPSHFTFVQFATFEKLWNLLSPLLKNPHQGLPESYKHIPKSKSILWLKQKEPTTKKPQSPYAQILPRWHARRDLAEILRLSLTQPLDLGQAEKLMKLVIDFDIPLPQIATKDTTFSELIENLYHHNPEDLRQKITQLESFDVPRWEPAGFWSSVGTFYKNQDTWQSTNFKQTSNQGNTLHIAPFSKAHARLWEHLAPLFKNPFTLGQDVDFCGTIRCLSLNENGRTDPKQSDLLFWTKAPLNHWSDQALIELADLSIIVVNSQQNIDPHTPLSRRNFIHWLLEYDQVDLKSPEKYYKFNDLVFEDPDYLKFNYLAHQKIIRGIGNGQVGADQPITRAEAIKILLSYQGFEGQILETPAFLDTQGWITPWANRAHTENLITEKNFRPQDILTWGEGAVLITKAINK